MQRRIALSLLALPLLGSLVALTACGGDDDGGSSNTVPAGAVAVRAVDGIAWNADEYTATAENGEVTIYGVNDSSIAHNLNVQRDGTTIGDPIDLPKKGSDGTITLQLEPGEYRVVCLISGHDNMNSALIVS
jgi:plastocyanin